MKKKLLLVAIGFALTTQMIIAQVPSYVPTNGLVGYWPFNGNANDITTNAYNGTVNGATITTDRFGNANSAYSFNGTSNYIGTSKIFNIIDNTPRTCLMWVKNTANLANRAQGLVYWGKNLQTLSKCFFGILPDNKGLFFNGFDADASFFINIPENQWVMLGYTYQNGIVSFFVNNQIVNSTNLGKTLSTPLSTLKFGSESENDYLNIEEYYKGVIDDIGIWNRALTQDEITGLYQSEVSCQSLVINSGTLSSFNPAVYQSTITIYPNPANDQITIDCGNLVNVSGWNIKIYNTLSQEVFSGAMNQQQYTIPLNTWGGQGVYFVKIYDASNNLMNTKKIILQ